MTAPTVDDVVARLRADPERTALLFDFDGTLSPVVDDPAAARPAPGAAEALDALAARYRTVAVVSGRPVSYLAAHLPPSLALSGLYGLESMVDGVERDHPEAERWRPVVAEATADALVHTGPGAHLEGALVESKGLSMTIHVRTRPDLAAAVEAVAHEVAARHGLEVRPAKRSYELHPPIAADKGTAARALLAGSEIGSYAGDDVGDVDAFDALAAARRGGELTDAVALAVGGPELPPAVADRAELVLDDPASMVLLLQRLAR